VGRGPWAVGRGPWVLELGMLELGPWFAGRSFL